MHAPYNPLPPSEGRLSALPSVLVIDDEVRSVEALERILEDDFDVKKATSIEEAEAILADEAIQVVLCDQRMPGMSGVEFLKVVRERWPDVVRMIISGYTDAEDIIQGVNEAAIYQYVTKPWPPDSLGGRALSRHERDGPTAVPSRARSLPAPYGPRRRALAAYTWLAPGVSEHDHRHGGHVRRDALQRNRSDRARTDNSVAQANRLVRLR